MSNENTTDSDLFKQAMIGVNRYKPPVRIKTIVQSPRVTEKQLAHRRQALSSVDEIDQTAMSLVLKDQRRSNEILSFSRSGLQWKMFRKLKKGQCDRSMVLDLHRLTVEQARLAVVRFIHDATSQGRRTVMIVHGKGERNLDTPALLKSYVAMWLSELQEVLAYHSAQPQHGGEGAVYVLLKNINQNANDIDT